ncbi:MAG: DUF4065 domain-containing protein [candidate division WOR-3 bacterium]|nr:DUF4065 domain-containing protein [candidate division WOR-3 bacterium]
MKREIIKDYCPKCNRITDLEINERVEKDKVKGQIIESEAKVPVCKECGEDVFIENFEEENLERAYNVYREKNKILFTDEIKAIRKRYDISQRLLAKALGWGEKTITRYENGDIPDKSHNEVLRLINKPSNFKEIFKNNKDILTDKEKNKVENAIKKICRSTEEIKFSVLSCLNDSPNQYNGQQLFQFDKFRTLIAYFAKNVDGLFKTKLNKFLFYSDFIAFREYNRSITGLFYVHLDYGPVPSKYDVLLSILTEERVVDECEVVFPNGTSGTVYKNCIDPNMREFTQNEKDIIDLLIREIGQLNSKQLSEISHKEDGYINTEKHELISYEYAKTLRFPEQIVKVN